MIRVRNGMEPGSSPRGRGKLLVEHTYTIWARLIPARAGKTTY